MNPGIMDMHRFFGRIVPACIARVISLTSLNLRHTVALCAAPRPFGSGKNEAPPHSGPQAWQHRNTMVSTRVRPVCLKLTCQPAVHLTPMFDSARSCFVVRSCQLQAPATPPAPRCIPLGNSSSAAAPAGGWGPCPSGRQFPGWRSCPFLAQRDDGIAQSHALLEGLEARRGHQQGQDTIELGRVHQSQHPLIAERNDRRGG